MSRKNKYRVHYSLDSGEIRSLPFLEIKAILRGAEEMITTGGRTLLARLLKGSKDKIVLRHQLDKCPVYGYFKDCTIAEITQKIDWMIKNHYLRLEYFGKLPMLAYTDQGGEIERNSYDEELLHGFDAMIEGGAKDFHMLYLKDRNRSMIMLLLDKVENTNNPKYIPLLRAWQRIDYRKVATRITEVIQHLEQFNMTVQ